MHPSWKKKKNALSSFKIKGIAHFNLVRLDKRKNIADLSIEFNYLSISILYKYSCVSRFSFFGKRQLISNTSERLKCSLTFFLILQNIIDFISTHADIETVQRTKICFFDYNICSEKNLCSAQKAHIFFHEL